MSLKNLFLQLLPYFPGTNELISMYLYLAELD